ncbi:hypothetical protein [uncultured Lutibacter sp.]|uniref:hypothetical protein n=1 Tax=uncultured Lutibacter sp. TaxID=437739 RepID=UPI002623FC13|nr:hypothetical protein [uncultured Lutibacter sp.]
MKQSLLLLFIICSSSIFAQANIENPIIKPLQENIVYREKVFLHLNKSIYFTNETIWVTAYVAEDAENKPSVYTSNLSLNLIDSEGNLVEQKTIFIKKGVGFGDFLLNKNLLSGKYYLQGFTNYMLNFGNENVFTQEIEIINSSLEKNENQEEYVNSYDIQLFPESGYLLENTENVIGIKALINGKGFPFSGKITNSKGEVENNFIGNELGMGKCVFNYNENETYTAIVNINNTTQNINIPKANKTGVIFSVDNSHEKELIVTLKTNEQTLPSLQNSDLALLFYRNNYISQAVTLSLINNEETIQELVFDKSKMLNGVNIITLFKNNQPIAERKIFVNKQQEQTAILINKLKTENDSITYKVKTLNSKLEPILSQLSISVLPKNSKNFQENQTIKSAFLLTPYVKGEIEDPSFYFKNNNKKQKEFLDLLLLNQGWSTYSLEEKIKEINPPENYKFESGFTVNGKIKWYPKGYNMGIMSKKGGLIASSEINENNQFSFENVFGYKNDSIKIALIKNKSPLVKPLKVSFIADTTTINKFSFIPNSTNHNPIIKAEITVLNEENNVSSFNNYPDVEVLNQVVLKTVKSKRKRTFYDDEMDIANKRNTIASGFYENKKVTESMEDTYLHLLHYFQQIGMVEGNCPSNCILRLRKTRKSFLAPIAKPIVYINGVRIDEDTHIEVLEATLMGEVDEILINRSGAGGGLDASGGIVKIFLKKANHKYYKYGKTLYKDLILLTGFDRANDYYKPQYNIYTEDAYNWSEIDWKNNLQTNEKGEVFIKIPTNEFSNEFQFIINGFSEDGLLFNTIYKTGDEITF